MSFHCPVCDARTQVTNTRAELRKRICRNGHRFWTEEVETELKVYDKPGRPRKAA